MWCLIQAEEEGDEVEEEEKKRQKKKNVSDKVLVGHVIKFSWNKYISNRLLQTPTVYHLCLAFFFRKIAFFATQLISVKDR